jgi:hypothetical protein
MYSSKIRIVEWEFSILILLICTCSFANLFGQSVKTKTFVKPDVEAIYLKGNSSLIKYYSDTLSSVLLKCNPKNEMLMTKLVVDFVISEKGTVTDVKLVKPKIDLACRKVLIQTLLAMKGWSPALKNNKAIKSEYRINLVIDYNDEEEDF